MIIRVFLNIQQFTNLALHATIITYQFIDYFWSIYIKTGLVQIRWLGEVCMHCSSYLNTFSSLPVIPKSEFSCNLTELLNAPKRNSLHANNDMISVCCENTLVAFKCIGILEGYLDKLGGV